MTPVGAGKPCYFEVLREDQVKVSSTQFCGGLWRWRLFSPDGAMMAGSVGYGTERACRGALAALCLHSASATQPVIPVT